MTPDASKHDDGAKKGSNRGIGWIKEEGGKEIELYKKDDCN